MKNTPNQDDQSIATIVVILAQLISKSVEEIKRGIAVDISAEPFYRVSCKLDAAVLMLLTRSNSLIRRKAIEILSDFHTIQEALQLPSQCVDGIPLVSIIYEEEETLGKRAFLSFFKKSSRGNAVTSRMFAGFNYPSVYEVLQSEYTRLFHYYLGELVLLFIDKGRSKAKRHCAKLLALHTIPRICDNLPERTVEGANWYSASMILLMCHSGVPVFSVFILDVLR